MEIEYVTRNFCRLMSEKVIYMEKIEFIVITKSSNDQACHTLKRFQSQVRFTRN
jgi:hypothetical protein